MYRVSVICPASRSTSTTAAAGPVARSAIHEITAKASSDVPSALAT